MWDSVPWFVGGGAQHSPEVARLLAYAATSGAEGIVTPSDLKVTPLDVPGGAIRVMPGAALVLNRSAGGSQQTYVARLPQAEQVAIAPTGSSGPRTDMIVAQIEDPFLPGEPWQEPADPTVGPYVFTRVIPNVPADATRIQDVPGYAGRSAIPLARIKLPASTGTVTAAMITDLRKVAQPREQSEVRAMNVLGNEKYTINSTTAAPAGGQTWPAQAEDIGIEINIPEWATVVKVIATWGSVAMPAGNATGNMWVQIAPTVNPDNIKTETGAYNSDNKGEFSRETWVVADTKTIPPALRGTRQKFYPRARIDTGIPTAQRPWADWATSFILHVVFQEVPD